MAYNPNRENIRKKRFIRETIIKGVILVVLALIIASEIGYRGGDMQAVMDNMETDLFTVREGSIIPIMGLLNVTPFYPDWAAKCVALAIGIWLIWFLSDWTSYINGKNMRPGEEHGSASFNLAYGKMLHDYMMSPKLLKKGKEREIFDKIIKQGGSHVTHQKA